MFRFSCFVVGLIASFSPAQGASEVTVSSPLWRLPGPPGDYGMSVVLGAGQAQTGVLLSQSPIFTELSGYNASGSAFPSSFDITNTTVTDTTTQTGGGGNIRALSVASFGGSERACAIRGGAWGCCTANGAECWAATWPYLRHAAISSVGITEAGILWGVFADNDYMPEFAVAFANGVNLIPTTLQTENLEWTVGCAASGACAVVDGPVMFGFNVQTPQITAWTTPVDEYGSGYSPDRLLPTVLSNGTTAFVAHNTTAMWVVLGGVVVQRLFYTGVPLPYSPSVTPSSSSSFDTMIMAAAAAASSSSTATTVYPSLWQAVCGDWVFSASATTVYAVDLTSSVGNTFQIGIPSGRPLATSADIACSGSLVLLETTGSLTSINTTSRAVQWSSSAGARVCSPLRFPTVILCDGPAAVAHDAATGTVEWSVNVTGSTDALFTQVLPEAETVLFFDRSFGVEARALLQAR